MWRARAERQASQLLGIIVSCSIVVTLCLSLTHFQFPTSRFGLPNSSIKFSHLLSSSWNL